MRADHDTTASMLAEIVCASVRRSGGEPDEAQVLLAAVEAAPEFDRLWDAGRRPVLSVEVDDGRLVLRVTDGGAS